MEVPARRISDPIHSTIGLSDLEARIIGTRVFQRLRNVKQLGLAYLVFPGSDYSRFSHSLGVCHITGLILKALMDVGVAIESTEYQKYRLAGLLHDVGHYPFSHAMEEAIQDHYSSSLYRDRARTGASASDPDEGLKVFRHERVGKEVLSKDPEIREVLRANQLEPQDISRIFTREEPPRFANLISSDLDADRIDYLLRTAHHSGLPYGSVDLPYLLSQMRVDSNEKICLTAKALRTADHFLLCRYFDYQQVSFHKTVAAFEYLLKDVLAALLSAHRLDCSAKWVSAAIGTGQWTEFDDVSVINRIRELANDSSCDSLTRDKALAILHRRPPKLLGEIEYLKNRSELREFRSFCQLVAEKIPKWAGEFGVEQDRWHLWKPTPMVLTTVGSRIPMTAVAESTAKDKDKLEQTIRVLSTEGGTSQPISENKHSLMSLLSDYALYSMRIYVLFPEGKEHLRASISTRLKDDLPDLAWK